MPVKQTVLVEKTVQVEKVVTATPVPMTYKEAPMLAELVKAGKLPPRGRASAAQPVVPPMVEGMGKYGGTMRRGFQGVADANGPRKLEQQVMLIVQPKDLSCCPNLVEAWELNADATQFTFSLRKGMKWSDGAALDSDAFKWWYENMLNKTLTPAIGAPLDYDRRRWQEDAMTMEFPDKIYRSAQVRRSPPALRRHYVWPVRHALLPGHYLKQFHADTGGDKAALDEAYKEGRSLTAWDKLFGNRNNWAMNPDLPLATPWLPKNQMSRRDLYHGAQPLLLAGGQGGQPAPLH